MNHAVVTEHLADYLEGDLALDLRALVDAHLDTCETCAQEVREMQQTIRLLRALPEPEVPPMIAANVMRRIRAGEAEPSLLDRIRSAFGGVLEPSFVLPASAVAVAALVVLVIQGAGPFSRSLAGAGERALEASGEARVASVPAATAASAAEGTDRNFGASAAREFAAASAPRRVRDGAGESREAGAGSQPLREERNLASTQGARGPITASPWAPPSLRRELAGSASGGESFFGDPVLAQGYVSDVSGPGLAQPSSRFPGEVGTAVPSALSRPLRGGDSPGFAPQSSGGEDPRDLWLAQALEHPAEFAQYIARHNLAEQEIWVERLSERAHSRGLLAELVETLRAAGDEKASWLADDFAAQAPPADSGEAPRASRSDSGGER